MSKNTNENSNDNSPLDDKTPKFLIYFNSLMASWIVLIVIAVCFFFAPSTFPLIVGAVFLLLKLKYENVVKKSRLTLNDIILDYETKHQLLESEYNTKEQNLITDYESKNQLLESEYNTKEQNLITDYESKNQLLESEYNTKEQNLITDYETKIQSLQNDYATKEQNLADNYVAKNQSLESDYNIKEQKLTTSFESKKQLLENDYKTREHNLITAYKSKEQNLKSNYENQEKSYNDLIRKLKHELNHVNIQLSHFDTELLVNHYNFSMYDDLSSEECKNNLILLKTEENALIKDNKAVEADFSTSFYKKELNNNIKKILRSFNSECDNILLNLKSKNINTLRNKLQKSFLTLNKIFETDNIQLSHELLKNKLEQLNLVYTFELKKEQEREEQKAIREQMLEEEKVRREIEREKSKLEKEESQFKNEISKLIQYLHKTELEIEKNLYLDKITELENKLKLLQKDKENVLQREQNTRAGFVYVISNIGSFGENIYKIGMTRRLQPMDRVNELSSASVPFPFDVHAMIFSEDAPTLETTLHNHFKKYELNKVNHRKEFFKVDLSEIEKVVKENHNATVTFTLHAIAKDYRESIAM